MLAFALFSSPVMARAQGTNDLQPSPRIAAPVAGPAFDTERLARIDRWVEGLISTRKIPGAVVMILRDGKSMYPKAYGVRDLGTRVPLRNWRMVVRRVVGRDS